MKEGRCQNLPDVRSYLTLPYYFLKNLNLSHDMRFPTLWYVRPAKAQTSLLICADWSEHLLVAEYSSTVQLLTEHNLERLSLTGGCTGLSESKLVKLPWLLEITCLNSYIFQAAESLLVSLGALAEPTFHRSSNKSRKGQFVNPFYSGMESMTTVIRYQTLRL